MRRPAAGRRLPVAIGLALVAPAVPLVVALVARRHPVWVPDLDLALTELRVRDVGSSHGPLVGLPGRIGTLEQQGSHPGPISFYLLAPIYRALGSTSFALQVATVALHLAAATTTVALVLRRVGRAWALAASGALVVLIAGVGPDLFTEPWNPYLPILWWPAFLIGVWCCLQGDARGVAVVVIAGAICGQTHVPYLGPVVVLTVLAVAGWLRWGPAPRRGQVILGAALLAVALWAPPLLDQVRHDPGNASLLADHLLSPPEPAIGGRTGARLVLERLDLAHLVRSAVVDPGLLGERFPTTPSAGRGAVLVVALAAVGALTRGRTTASGRAALVVAVGALAAAWVASARIVGHPWPYLMLWVWPIGLWAALSVAGSVLVRSVPSASGRRVASIVGVLLLVGLAVRAAADARLAEPTNPTVSRTVLALVPDVVASLEPDGRYLVTWSDAVHLGAHGYGMVDELERRGIDVVVPATFATPFGEHRSVEGRAVDGQLVVATGRFISRWRAQPGQEVAEADVRTPSERAEASRLRAELAAVLEEAGLPELVPLVDDNLFAVAVDPRVPEAARPLLDRLDVLGAAAAVFLVPPGSALP